MMEDDIWWTNTANQLEALEQRVERSKSKRNDRKNNGLVIARY